jgi:hypothetical protein
MAADCLNERCWGTERLRQSTGELSNCPVVCTRDYELQRADVPANEWDTTETERLCLVLQAGLTV